MSYILDALRRAESERGRGAVPGLHTQAPPAGGASAAGRPVPANLWAGAALGVVAVAVLAAGGTWWFLQRQAPAAERVVVAAPAPAAPAAPVTPAPVAPAAPDPVPAPRPVDKRAAPSQRERPAAPAASPPVARASAAEPARPRVAPGQSPAQDAAVVFAQGDLPDAVRAQLPALKVSGATHSNNPAYRMAIVNGQVLHEGEQAAPGLLLERIEPGRTVWSFRGYRYAVVSE